MGETMNAITADYDRSADVFYFTIGDEGAPSEYEDTQYGVTIRYAASNRHPIGVIVVGYDQYGWASDTKRLARVIGELLSMPVGEVDEAISKIH